jgi:predicted acylesterase/phospholipase RssA
MLSGGGTYGYVYIGIYRFLKEYNLLKDIKYMYGTSIGSPFLLFTVLT